MYGPSQNQTNFDSTKTIPPANNSNIKFDVDDDIGGVALQHVELEILLSMKIDYGLSFDQAVVAAMAHTDYEFMFSFPPERFPIECNQVSCIRMKGELGGGDSFLYIHQQKDGGRVEVADVAALGDEFLNFARSFAGVVSQIRNLDSMQESSDTTH